MSSSCWKRPTCKQGAPTDETFWDQWRRPGPATVSKGVTRAIHRPRRPLPRLPMPCTPVATDRKSEASRRGASARSVACHPCPIVRASVGLAAVLHGAAVVIKTWVSVALTGGGCEERAANCRKHATSSRRLMGYLVRRRGDSNRSCTVSLPLESFRNLAVVRRQRVVQNGNLLTWRSP